MFLANLSLILSQLNSEKFELELPETIEYQGVSLGGTDEWSAEAMKGLGVGANTNGTNTTSTENAKGHLVRGEKVIYYKISALGEVEADLADFSAKVQETLEDERGWKNAGLKFMPVSRGQDVNIILSDSANLDKISGCSGDLSCTTFNNEVIINDLRWREGTEASRTAGMETRDYQHMVINHEVGHWLGHYQHETRCENGGPAPIMLQQSTGLRGCESFNAWPLEEEWWTLR